MKLPVELDVTNENYHLGHLFVDVMKNRPDAICQIDAATGKSETNAVVLSRSIQLARCLRRIGMKPGDIMTVGGRNNLDVHVALYAALLNGMPIAGIDALFNLENIVAHFSICRPKVAFCEKELIGHYQKVVEKLQLDTKLVCFGEGERSMKEFVEEHDDKSNDDEFEIAIFDLDKIYATLLCTGGTTGKLKIVAIKHKEWVNRFIEVPAVLELSTKRSEEENSNALNVAPVQWVSGFLMALAMPILHLTKVQTSGPRSIEHLVDIINKYKPISVILTTMLLNSTFVILEDNESLNCDFTCFDSLLVGGTKLHTEGYMELRKRMRPDAHIIQTYGQTENMGLVFKPVPNLPEGACGSGKQSWHELKLVDIQTGKEITQPNVQGELLTKGPRFTEYYRDPELTATVLTEDGWYKTGDLMYRDENDNYYFVERIEMMINGQASASEIEDVIRAHPDVRDVCVTSGKYQAGVTACVVRKPGTNVTAQEIMDHVASQLPESQRLHGGVIFIEAIPLTSTGKVARAKVKQIALNSQAEGVVEEQQPGNPVTPAPVITVSPVTPAPIITVSPASPVNPISQQPKSPVSRVAAKNGELKKQDNEIQKKDESLPAGPRIRMFLCCGGNN